MAISIPFDLDASAVPLEQNLMDIPLGPAAQISVYVTEVPVGYVITGMTFVAKLTPQDAPNEPTTISKTISRTVSSAGVIAPTNDATVWLGTFFFTAQDSVSLELTIRIYSITATTSPDGLSGFQTRVIQQGQIQALAGAFDVTNTLLDGTYTLDGEITLTGFPS